MIGGAISCVFWYVIGYMKYQSFSNWMAGGLWRRGFIGLDTHCEQIHFTHAKRGEGIVF